MRDAENTADIVPVERAVSYIKTDNLFNDAEHIINAAQSFSRSAVNVTLVRRNWLLGKRIAEEEFNEDGRADYGTQAIKQLAKRLTAEHGRGFAAPTLYRFAQFYKCFPDIFSTASRKSGKLLTWSHYSELLRVERPEARAWYEREALEQGWSVRTLQRNISTLYYAARQQRGREKPAIMKAKDL